jgi:hypothetical protein
VVLGALFIVMIVLVVLAFGVAGNWLINTVIAG